MNVPHVAHFNSGRAISSTEDGTTDKQIQRMQITAIDRKHKASSSNLAILGAYLCTWLQKGSLRPFECLMKLPTPCLSRIKLREQTHHFLSLDITLSRADLGTRCLLVISRFRAPQPPTNLTNIILVCFQEVNGRWKQVSVFFLPFFRLGLPIS